VADNNRPHWIPGSTSGHNDESVVDGTSVTPEEGLDTLSVPSLPVRPEEVLELLRARLALDELSQPPALTGTVAHERATAPISTWPPVSGALGRTPSSPDITPSPVVIGVGSLEAAKNSVPNVGEITSNPSDNWRDPGAIVTPAEPVASLRVRQLSHHEPVYFPPMKPPGPSQRAPANEAPVNVVPDCDVRSRTLRKLRRPPGRPGLSEGSERRNLREALAIVAAGLAIALLVGIDHERASGQPHPAHGSNGTHSVQPIPPPLRTDDSVRQILPEQVVPSAILDSGTVNAETPVKSNASIHPAAQSASRGQKAQISGRDAGGARSQTPGRGGLVF